MGRKTRRIEIAAFFILATGFFLRLYALGRTPYGLNQDEASIGYEAFTLANYGVDRYGNPWPVYPITWGSGGGSPLMIYLAVITTKLFGCNVLSLRLMPAVLGCVTLVLFYLFIRRMFGERAGLFAAVIISFNPWHLMMSRWELDCNTLPFWLLAAILCMVYGVQRKSTKWYLVSSVLFALCVYAYGSATIVVPVSLVVIAAYALGRKDLSARQLATAVIVFLIVLIPIGVFYVVNYLGLPDISTPLFSVIKFTGRKSIFYGLNAGLLSGMGRSFLYLLRFLTIGSKDTEIICSQIPGYGTMYRFTFPLLWIGIWKAAQTWKQEKHPADACMGIILAVSFVFSLFIELNISRMAMFLIPMLYFQVRGLETIAVKQNLVAIACTAAVGIAAVFFVRDYFGERYQSLSAENFMPGYGEAVRYADSVSQEGQTVYSTYRHVAAPFMVALYYLQTPADEFIETVQWREEGAEFMVADSFGKYVFGLPEHPEELLYNGEVLILHREELEPYADWDGIVIEETGMFAVVHQEHYNRVEEE